MTSATTVTPTVTANSVYNYPSPQVRLRIGTGGSGQSGLLQALAEAFIKTYNTPGRIYLAWAPRLIYACHSSTEQNGTPQFSIEWYTSDTTVSIDYLKKKVVDIGITYHAVAEHTALTESIVDRVEYVWRDHWMLVGMKAFRCFPVGPHAHDIVHRLTRASLSHQLVQC